MDNLNCKMVFSKVDYILGLGDLNLILCDIIDLRDGNTLSTTLAHELS